MQFNDRKSTVLLILAMCCLAVAITVLAVVITAPTSSVADNCSPSWQENRNAHQPTVLDVETVLELASGLADEADFETHLDSILGRIC